MKTKKLILTGLLVFGTLSMQAQNTEENASVTSGGLQSGNYGTGNAFYGYKAGNSTGVLGSPVRNNNTYIGNLAGESMVGSNNLFIGYKSGIKKSGFGLTLERYGSGNVFIGANTGLTVPENTVINPEDYNNKLIIDNSSTTTPLIWGDFEENQLKFHGKVGIGLGFGDFPITAGILGTGPIVDVSAYNLFVYGGILTEEVRVILNGWWADYVFEEDYSMLNLQELETFIKENKHLPNVPSAKEVKENGIELGEMAKIQQEKIEELVLYIIEQNKINKEQAEQLAKQQEELNQLKEQVKFLLETQK